MSTPVQGTQSFGRSIALLQQIADAGRPTSRSELAAASGLTRPTLYRIIASLEAEGLIEPTGQNTYRLGSRLISLARAALAQNDIRQIASVELERLRDATGETVHLAVPGEDAMIYIDKKESRAVVRMMSTIGARIPFHSTSVGKAYLGALPPRDSDSLIDRIERPMLTEFTVTDPSELKRVVEGVRETGFAREEQENEPGIVCFGSAIRDRAGRPVAAISVSIPMFRLDAGKDYAAAVIRTADAISRELGLQPE